MLYTIEKCYNYYKRLLMVHLPYEHIRYNSWLQIMWRDYKSPAGYNISFEGVFALKRAGLVSTFQGVYSARLEEKCNIKNVYVVVVTCAHSGVWFKIYPKLTESRGRGWALDRLRSMWQNICIRTLGINCSYQWVWENTVSCCKMLPNQNLPVRVHCTVNYSVRKRLC